MAATQQGQSRYAEAEILRRRELDLEEKAYGKDSLAVGVTLSVMGTLQESQGKYSEAEATLAPMPDEDALALAWTDPADLVERRVRAAAPWPGAFTEIGGEIVTLTRVRPTDDVPRALERGEAVVRADGLAVVRAADRGVELLAGRVEHGEEAETELDAAALAELVRRVAPEP